MGNFKWRAAFLILIGGLLQLNFSTDYPFWVQAKAILLFALPLSIAFKAGEELNL